MLFRQLYLLIFPSFTLWQITDTRLLQKNIFSFLIDPTKNIERNPIKSLKSAELTEPFPKITMVEPLKKIHFYKIAIIILLNF